MIDKPVAVDVFSGPGGLTEGFRQAGFTVTVAVDSDKHACKTYRRNHRKTRVIEKDMYSVSGQEILDASVGVANHDLIDVVMGGPPCRGLSSANSRSRGEENPYNRLFWEFVRLVGEIKPNVYVIENVKSLYNFNSGLFKDQIIAALDDLGYSSAAFVLCAASFGVPQLRMRTFIIGTKRDAAIGQFQMSSPTHGPNLQRYVTVAEAISDLPLIPEGGGGASVTSYIAAPRTYYQDRLREDCAWLHNHMTSKSGPTIVERFRQLPEGGNWADIADLLRQSGDYEQIANTHSGIYRRLKWHEPAYTMVNPRKSMYVHPEQNRLLSVREVARLQSFSDRYIFEGALNSMQQQVADAVPVFLGKTVAQRVKKCLFPRVHLVSIAEKPSLNARSGCT